MTQQDFITIFGAPRSGTYLLSTLLQRHFSIAIPVETHLAPVFSKKLWAFGNLSKASNRLRLLNCMYNYIEILIDRGFRLNTPEAQKDYSLLITRPNKKMIVDQSRDFKSLVSNLFANYATLKGCKHWADKSAFYKPFNLGTFSKEMGGNIKVINIVRDGRDVALSWCQEWFGPKNILAAADLWKKHVDAAYNWEVLSPECILNVRFEDLIEDMGRELDRIESFLNLERHFNQEDSLGIRMANMLGKEYHSKITDAPDQRNQKKWLTVMNNHHIEIFENIAGQMLELHNYKLQTTLKPGVGRINLPEIFRWTHCERLVKNQMPVILSIASSLNIPITRFLIRD
tara:strand:- start:13613 stop:14641 length:1029 start_codon:yes stop_codon:yes gene_type:complete